jgi:hypothetical protein
MANNGLIRVAGREVYDTNLRAFDAAANFRANRSSDCSRADPLRVTRRRRAKTNAKKGENYVA